jgi:hypothetical protein
MCGGPLFSGTHKEESLWDQLLNFEGSKDQNPECNSRKMEDKLDCV